jgi:uncharacterized protein YcfJ
VPLSRSAAWQRRTPRRIAMKNSLKLLLVPVALFAAACGRDNSKTDDALNSDLALAAQAQPYNAQQFTSPTEMGYAYNPYTGQFQPVPQAQAPVVQRVATRPAASTVRRTSTASSGTRVVYQEPAPIKRNTKRDAVIGAAAGAVIGATVSRDRVKGGVIGAVAGGVLGGIIGHTIDVQRP